MRRWVREEEPNGPGKCPCGAWANWTVTKFSDDDFYLKSGHVIVISDKGWQQLYGPDFRAHPNAWKSGGPKIKKANGRK